ncbi:MAG: hypothetical protein EPO65_10230 [Dehalococcoidia bacterium]|nr:MAG: hypothetical protein EPO65_10230 [Dehalococcoidia bacterium]
MWAIDGMANFLPYAGLPLLLVPAATLVMRHRVLALASALLLVAWLAVLLAPNLFFTHASAAAATGPKLRVVTANVLMSNDQLPALADDVLAQDPDVIVFEELQHDVATVSPRLAEAYPYRISTSEPWVTIASRFPLEDAQRLQIASDDRGRDLLKTIINVNGQRLTLIGVHFMPPLNGEAFEVNRQQRELLEHTVDGVDGPLLVVGDFNATTLSPTFARLLLGTHLRIASTGHLMKPTYFTYGRLGVRIDHVLTRRMDVVDDSVFSLTGSDHRGVSVELGLPDSSNAVARTR